jgi:hypothetical protein
LGVQNFKKAIPWKPKQIITYFSLQKTMLQLKLKHVKENKNLSARLPVCEATISKNLQQIKKDSFASKGPKGPAY